MKYLAEKKLKHLLGKITSYSKNSEQFVSKLKNHKVKDGDILVSFDVVSLYT